MQPAPDFKSFFTVVKHPPSACKEAEDCPHGEVCPLSKVSAGTSVLVKRLSAPPETSKRLREMGFTEDQTIRLVSQQTSVICQVCNARLGISKELAEQIWVQPMGRRVA